MKTCATALLSLAVLSSAMSMSSASAQAADGNYIFRYKSAFIASSSGPGGSDDSGTPPPEIGENPLDPDESGDPGEPGGISLETEPDFEDGGTANFSMEATDSGSSGNTYYSCFEVSGGHGHYAYNTDAVLPSWVVTYDVVPRSALSSPTGSNVTYPEPVGAMLNLTSETEACVRIQTANPIPAGGEHLDLAFIGLSYTVPVVNFDEDDFDGISVMAVRLRPPAAEVSGIIANNLFLEYYEEENELADWEPGDPVIAVADEYVLNGVHHSCFDVSGGVGNYAFKFYPLDTPSWVQYAGWMDNGDGEFNFSYPFPWREDGTWPDYQGQYYTTTDNHVCLGIQTQPGSSGLFEVNIEVLDFDEPNVTFGETTPPVSRIAVYRVTLNPVFE